jgi:hypothetical protein
MSGGSYNYLCNKDAGNIADHLDSVREMANRLEGINPDGHAAADTYEVIAIVNALDFAITRMYSVWHAVEWRDSCDWLEAQMMEEIGAYEAAREAEELATLNTGTGEEGNPHAD